MSNLAGRFRFKTVGEVGAEHSEEARFKPLGGGFWSRRIRSGEDGEEEEEAAPDGDWIRVRASGDEEDPAAALYGREEEMETLEGEKTGELEIATVQDIISVCVLGFSNVQIFVFRFSDFWRFGKENRTGFIYIGRESGVGFLGIVKMVKMSPTISPSPCFNNRFFPNPFDHKFVHPNLTLVMFNYQLSTISLANLTILTV